MHNPTPEQIAFVRAIERRCKGPAVTKDVAEKLRALGYGQSVVSESRVPCGRDFNDVILAHPFDGQDRVHTCSCGNVINWKSPIF